MTLAKTLPNAWKACVLNAFWALIVKAGQSGGHGRGQSSVTASTLWVLGLT
jgi:hypothetical protein